VQADGAYCVHYQKDNIFIYHSWFHRHYYHQLLWLYLVFFPFFVLNVTVNGLGVYFLCFAAFFFYYASVIIDCSI
jgi:hypothetical protein